MAAATQTPRIDKIRSRRRISRGFKALLQLVILVAIVVVAMVSAFGVLERISATNAQLSQVEAEIAIQLYTQQELDYTTEYAQSQEFIENIARSFLGLVYPDEIIFNMTE